MVCGVKSAPLNEICTSGSQSSQIVSKSHALFCYLATVKPRQKFLKRTSNLCEEGFVCFKVILSGYFDFFFTAVQSEILYLVAFFRSLEESVDL